ncbi:DJ-1/PfpI family protein [Phycicoccus sp. Root101]|uniref:DJ-1/PfpI family protein n=1 Tax=Phycicoccus sp. Root101 TaxID=1736421 RepID=UPI000702F511|nr:DJ-1/PfpI family protein [Phycicoccus sp. Root101]KQU68970.1 thiamine biosynthesis protein ThiJ [Phycicoccus sp. Root101]
MTSPDITQHSSVPVAARHIGILLFDDVEELDAVGPWEVLANWTMNHPQDGWSVSFVSSDGNPVRAAKGLVLAPHHSVTTMPALQALIHPGGQGTRSLMCDPDHLGWVRQQRMSVPLLASVCTGALVYAAAGVLVRRPATTHWQSLDLLHELDASIDVRDSTRFVDDGDVITSAGVSAGIDMALHLVARMASADRARIVRRDLQYDPQPPI